MDPSEIPQGIAVQGVAWASLDPIQRKIDFYPQTIAQRVENSLAAGEDCCVLGSDFFNATIHFNNQTGESYQTTPGQHLGRGGFKQPGYRTVKRVIQRPGQSTSCFYGRRIHGEWRLVDTPQESEWTFTETIPSSAIVRSEATPADPLRAWRATDLEGDEQARTRQAVIIWQWCRGTTEANGDLMRLGDEVWCPYLQGNNEDIERAFSANAEAATIGLETRTLRIVFNPGSTFALQRDDAAHKERLVRRTTKTAQDVWMMVQSLQAGNRDPGNAQTPTWQPTASLAVPPEFFCPISQELMLDPVNTCDNQTYDRPGIEQWFLQQNTSPLTGLSLPNKTLVSNEALKAAIEMFTAAHPAAQ